MSTRRSSAAPSRSAADRELPEGSALALARRIREGEDSAEAAVHRALAAIAQRNPRVAAFSSVAAYRAVAAARAKDRARRSGGSLPPFHGVPIGLKDLHLVRGHFARMGSRAFRYVVSPIDDVTAAAIRSAGFVIVGKLSTSELGLLPYVEPDIHAPTRNPWNEEYTAGGSSGGSGAAVASGMLTIAPGSDGGGSVRIPSALCGLFGFKPSRGRLPNPHAGNDPHKITTIGPMATSVDDAAALLDVLARLDSAEPGSWFSAIGRPVTSLRVRMAVESPIGTTDPEIARAVRGIGKLLRELGHSVEEVSPPRSSIDEFLPTYSRMFANLPIPVESHLQPITRWMREQGRMRTQDDSRRAFEALRGKVDSLFGNAHVLLTPTVAMRPPKIGAHLSMTPEEQWEAAAPMGAFTAGFNAGGNPAATLPAGVMECGVPIGAQIVARESEDLLVLSLARQIERALGGFSRGVRRDPPWLAGQVASRPGAAE